jgi:ribulose-phosphate 3-epimerase
MIEVIPAVVPHTLDEIKTKFRAVLGLVKKVQIDVVDGFYAPTTTWPFNGGLKDDFVGIAESDGKMPYYDDFLIEFDLFVVNPIQYLDKFIKVGGRGFVFHIDSTQDMTACIETAKLAGSEVGLGIRPSKDTALLESFVNKIDFVQFMGNDRVGYNGVELDLSVLPKISAFHDRYPDMPLQIDIGVNFETAPLLKKAGITRIVSGTTIYNSTDIKQAILSLQN